MPYACQLVETCVEREIFGKEMTSEASIVCIDNVYKVNARGICAFFNLREVAPLECLGAIVLGQIV